MERLDEAQDAEGKVKNNVELRGAMSLTALCPRPAAAKRSFFLRGAGRRA